MPHFDFDGAYDELMEHQENILAESIKSDLDKLGADKIDRKGKLITLTWKSGDLDEIKKKTDAAMAAHKDKIKHIGVVKDGTGVKAEIDMK
jgi:hypothetical protein